MSFDLASSSIIGIDIQHGMDFTAESDWELIKLSNENPEYFRYIVERYQDRIFRYLKRMSYYRVEDIEDMLQEIFIKVYRNMNEFDRTAEFSSLIYRIAHNHLVDQIRKSQVRKEHSYLDDEETLSLIKASTNIHQETVDKETLEKVKRSIDELPVNYKEVLVLKILEEKKIEEIVDILRKPQGTVATLLRRGREMLKNNLADSGIKL